MEAKDLRIGNWYKTKSSSPGLTYRQATFFEDAHYASLYCDPIPLNEEWLKRLGFSKKIIDGFWAIDLENNTFLCSGGKAVWIEKEIQGELFSVGLCGAEYVHEVQNLYFALTGRELELKE